MYVYTNLLLRKHEFVSDIEEIIKYYRDSTKSTGNVTPFIKLNIALVAPNGYFVNLYRLWLYDNAKNARISIVDGENIDDVCRVADTVLFVNTNPPPTRTKGTYIFVVHVLGINPIMTTFARFNFRPLDNNTKQSLTTPQFNQKGVIFSPSNETNSALVSFKPPADFSRELTLVLFYHFVYSNIPQNRKKQWCIAEDTFNTLIGTWIGEAERVAVNDTNVPFINQLTVEGLVDGSTIRSDIRRWMAKYSKNKPSNNSTCMFQSYPPHNNSLTSLMVEKRNVWSINSVFYMHHDSETMSSIIRTET